jgi:hypothetical protein
MSMSGHLRYWNDSFQSYIFFSDIGITDVDVRYQRHYDRCQCPPMHMPYLAMCSFVPLVPL